MNCDHVLTRDCIILSARNPQTDPPITESFDFGSGLSRLHIVLETVFTYLGSNDLRTAMLIGPEWKEAATRELKKRPQSAWISLCEEKIGITRSRNYHLQHTAFFIAAHRASCKANSLVCCHKGNSCKEIPFSEFVEHEFAPSNTDYCILTATGVNPNTGINPKSCLCYGVGIPFIENVRIIPLYYSRKNRRSLEKYLKPHEELKCCLTFTVRYSETFADRFLDGIVSGPTNVAFGGGFIRESQVVIKNERKTGKPIDLFCILFAKTIKSPPNFEAISMVCSYNNFEEKVNLMLSTIVLRKDGVVFRFCCFDRKFKEAETAFLVKKFPNYAVFSIDVDGEIGWDSFATKEQGSILTPKRLRVVSHIIHSYSTIVVLLTWGKELTN